MVMTSDGKLTTYRETIAFAQLAELPLVLLHTQHLDAGLSPTPLLGDVDIVLARHLGIAGLPLPVLAATDASSARKLTGEALEIAERLRTPVIVLLSGDIAEAGVPPNRAATVSERLATPPEGLLPHDRGSDQANATVPRFDAAARPACAAFLGLADGRRVFLNLDAAQLDARLRRLRNKVMNAGDLLERVVADSDPEAETLLISYGHADQGARDAVQIVRANAARVSHLTIHSLWPLPQRSLRRAVTPFVRRVLLPELNMGLYADELSRVLRAVKIESITRCDGRPIEAETIARRITDWPCG